MGTVRDILIPQMGEGLQEVRIVEFQKQPGEYVKRDELLYSMETDKAVMEVESPYEGVLKEWLAEEEDVLPIGAPIARIETEAAVGAEMPTPVASPAPAPKAPAASTPAAPRREEVQIPPRTRAYGKEKGLDDEEIRKIPAASGKLMPSDIDIYLAGKEQPAAAAAETEKAPFVERRLSRQHRTFVYHLKRSAHIVVPAVAKRSMPWKTVRQVAETRRAQQAEVQPSSFQTFAYCVVQAVKEHPKFRSALIGDEVVREYAHLNLGIAVGTTDGQLTTAVVRSADTLTFDDFVRTAQAQIQLARQGEDQADETTQLLLTYMGPYDLTDAIPVLVAPAVGVLFIGTTFEQNGEPTVNLSLTFEHRLIHGIEAAEFLRAIVEKVKQVEQLIA